MSVALSTKTAAAETEGLEAYLQQKDTAFAWKLISKKTSGDFTILQLQMVSQKWRGNKWTHEMLVVRPKAVRSSDIGFLLVGGGESPASHLTSLKLLAERAGAITAFISQVPNQPLFNGLSEDALIAYTFDQFLRSGDATWPVLFPMVKSAVRGLDTIQAVAEKEFDQKIERFVVAGASKRGWTTWLTAAVDARVAGIAPMVFDMLNMKVQTAWSQKVYGRQSDM
ncbi:MAG: PhoPQ-activated pathogenicity-like protein PqaA type, partial [Verrucomicrobiales bacterium]|nr:PhoPQ-activated pathogenicity-like protein PqaA type [Verrucomicrobiales bacterium]